MEPIATLIVKPYLTVSTNYFYLYIYIHKIKIGSEICSLFAVNMTLNLP